MILLQYESKVKETEDWKWEHNFAVIKLIVEGKHEAQMRTGALWDRV